ncbi:MAG TPA: hypothetical protein VGL56_10340 [Fimbriimonadaceae bacterium]|jgi:hypothetical protein
MPNNPRLKRRIQIIWGVAAVLAIILAILLAVPQSHGHAFHFHAPYPVGVGPDPKLTPGDVNPDITEAVVTAPDFRTGRYRNVSEEEKQEDAAEYKVPWSEHSKYEFDHLIPLTVGGSNNLYNLWPEPLHINVNGYDLGAKTKDELEDAIGKLVRSGRMPIQEGQQLFKDWPAAYQEYVGDFPAYRTLQ